ncbi:TetR/AcrR family transcriptional regulator [Streptomyces sp. NPDC015232]|uniref:TetR/AcrR family transcriptional regulator n=1 Tax=unclassified Streptomyces TaxID=2593676 RepID=UPI0036FFC2A9
MPDVKHFDPDQVLDTVVRLFWKQGLATTGIQDIVDVTGLNRSSLYSTFGGKQQLYMAALERYTEERAPNLVRLAEDGRGLSTIEEFFENLIATRCTGEFAGWGCMVSNAHAGAEHEQAEVRAVLDRQHQRLLDALRDALVVAKAKGQLGETVDPGAAAEVLALLAHGVNIRSRAGADQERLRAGVRSALTAFTA